MKHASEERNTANWLSVAAGSPAIVVGSVLVAVAFGFALPEWPWDAIAVLVLIPLGLAAPTAAVVAILAITVLVPWDLQDQFQIFGGGQGERGVLFVDALLLLALARTGWMIVRRRIEFDLPMLLGTIVTGLLAAATVWGIARGTNISDAASEGRRVLFGSCTFLLVWPLLRDRATRRTLARWLVILGLALAIWGLVQYQFDVSYSTAGDVGVRSGLASKQLQGGMYVYPVAITLAWTALVTGVARTSAAKFALGAVLALNAICVVLTLERTLMLASALGCGFVVVIAGTAARRAAIKWGSGVAGLLLVGAVVAETHARSALERMALVGNLDSDNSYTHRVVEANVMHEQIAARPFLGSGFGATVTWGVPNKFATGTTTFADLGYHWLAWKIGLPLAVLIVVILIRAVFRRSRGLDAAQWHVLRIGSRGSLLALLTISILFGVFNALGVTAVIGLLVAVCFSSTTDSLYERKTHCPDREEENPLITARMETAR